MRAHESGDGAPDPASPRRWAFEGLTPTCMLDALAAAGWDGDGRLLQLNSYENRVVRISLHDGQRVVAKFYRPGRWSDAQILEEHAFAAQLAAADVPVAPPLPLHPDRPDPIGGELQLLAGADGQAPTLGRWIAQADADPGGGDADATVVADDRETASAASAAAAPSVWRLAVARSEPGRAPELDDPQVLERIGTYVARLHRVGAEAAFAHRRTLDAPADARASLATLRALQQVPPEQQAAWAAASDDALRVVDARWRRAGDSARRQRLHGDLHAGNVLWNGSAAHVVDLDDACNGPAVQDLWMLLSGDPQQARWQLAHLLDGYESLHAFDPLELALIPALRLLRMIRHNAWIAERHADPAFRQAWPDFGTSAYWGQQAMQLREVAAAADATDDA